MSLDHTTPQRRRLNASYSVSKAAYAFEATVEGPDFKIIVKESNENDVANPIKTTQALELASMIIEARKAFKEKGLPVIPFRAMTAEEQKAI